MGSLIVLGLLYLPVLWVRVTAKLPTAPLDFVLDAIMLLAALAATLVLCFYHGNLADRKALALALLVCSIYAGYTVRWLWRRKQAGPLVMAVRRTPLAILLSPMLVLVGIGTILNLVNGSAQTGNALVHVCSSITDLSVLAFLLLLVGVGVQFRKMGCLTFFRFVPWEAIEGYEWRPYGSTGRLLLWLKLRTAQRFFRPRCARRRKRRLTGS